MRKSKFSENQIITILKAVEAGRTVRDRCAARSIVTSHNRIVMARSLAPLNRRGMALSYLLFAEQFCLSSSAPANPRRNNLCSRISI
jgi:hypothetical protein